MGKRKIILIIVVIIVILILILGIILINNKKTIENNDNNNNIVNIPAFELIYEDNNNNKISTILKKGELPNYDYNIYVYGGNVKIKINNETLDLRDALLTGKINMSDIIGQCVKDAEENKIQTDMYEDGGSMEYRYDNYCIIKGNSLDGDKDVYISKLNVSYGNMKSAVGK